MGLKLISLDGTEARKLLDSSFEYLPGGYIDDACVMFDTHQNETRHFEGNALVLTCDGYETIYRAFIIPEVREHSEVPTKYVKMPKNEEGFAELFNQSQGSVYVLEETSREDKPFTFFIVAQ